MSRSALAGYRSYVSGIRLLVLFPADVPLTQTFKLLKKVGKAGFA